MKKKGISLVALVATVVVVAILLTTITISGVATLNNSTKHSLASELNMIQESVNAYLTKSEDQYPVLDSIVLDISQVSASATTQFEGEVITNNKVVLYALDYDLLGLASLKYGYKQQGDVDIYVMSKDTQKVYYAKGVTVGNKTYYTLTDELKAMVQYTAVNTTPLTKNAIVFVPTQVSWTKHAIDVQVKIPLEYLSKSVTVAGNTIAKATSDAEYDIYIVSGVEGNYTIVVNYAETSSSPLRSVKYNVNNVDNTPPVLTLDKENQVLLKASTKEETVAYVRILAKEDSLSGIKQIKYENERIKTEDIESYFNTNGTVIKKDIVPIQAGVKEITVYIEDNAGNWTADFVTVNTVIFTEMLPDGV